MVETRVGPAGFSDDKWRDSVSSVLQTVPANRPCFGNHVACYLAGDVVVGPVNFIFPSDYMTSKQVQQLMQDLNSHQVPTLILRSIYYLAVEVGANDHLGPFRAYLHEHYRFVRILPNTDEIWVRMQEVPTHIASLETNAGYGGPLVGVLSKKTGPDRSRHNALLRSSISVCHPGSMVQ